MELLSPAGNYEAFLAAVKAGADAVYIGGNKYGARAYADNFSDEEIISAIHYAHLFNVKVYLTVNTLIKEKEWRDVLEYVRPFYHAGLDACIVQDIGLISVFNKEFATMECHVSTQGFATDVNSVLLYKSLGASRVVLARELSLDEIVDIKDKCDIEIETFIHGSMCYSYSGQCLLSSCLGGRSGNRGRCAGPCRLPYSVISDGKESDEAYYLSMKDQCTLEMIPQLIDAGIDSLKIEGRMKKPEYTAFVTAIYRKYIDKYTKNPEAKYVVDKNDLDNLRHIYMRTEIGTGYYNIRNGKSMITLDNPAYSGNDDALMEKIRKDYLSEPRKYPVKMVANICQGEELSVYMTDNDREITVTGPIIEESINHPATREEIIPKLSKLGDTPFCLDSIEVNITGNCFVPVKVLNDLRREAVEKLKEEIFLTDFPVYRHMPLKPLYERDKETFDRKSIVSIMSEDQFTVVNSTCSDIYILVHHSLINRLTDFCNEAKANGNIVFVNFPHILRTENDKYYEELFEKVNASDVAGIMVHNFGSIALVGKYNYKGFVLYGSGLYAWNRQSIEFFKRYTDAGVVSNELSEYEANDLESDNYVCIYGKLPLMHSANCILKTSNRCMKNSGNPWEFLKDRKNVCFPAFRDCKVCENIIFNSVPTSLHDTVIKGKISRNNSLISFTDEDCSTVKDVLNAYEECFQGSGKALTGINYTKGYWKRGVE